MGPRFENHMGLDIVCDFRPSSDIFVLICSKNLRWRGSRAPSKTWLQKPAFSWPETCLQKPVFSWPETCLFLARSLAQYRPNVNQNNIHLKNLPFPGPKTCLFLARSWPKSWPKTCPKPAFSWLLSRSSDLHKKEKTELQIEK